MSFKNMIFRGTKVIGKETAIIAQPVGLTRFIGVAFVAPKDMVDKVASEFKVGDQISIESTDAPAGSAFTYQLIKYAAA